MTNEQRQVEIEQNRQAWVQGMTFKELQEQMIEAKRIAFDRNEDFARRSSAYDSLKRLDAEVLRRR